MRKYSVTMTGKKNGRAFSITKSTVLTAHDIQVSLYVDGKRMSGTNVLPRKSSYTVEYLVGNHSPYGVGDIRDMVDDVSQCNISYIAPGTFTVCKFTLDGATVASAAKEGGLVMWDLSGSVGGLREVFGTNPRTVLTVK